MLELSLLGIIGLAAVYGTALWWMGRHDDVLYGDFVSPEGAATLTSAEPALLRQQPTSPVTNHPRKLRVGRQRRCVQQSRRFGVAVVHRLGHPLCHSAQLHRHRSSSLSLLEISSPRRNRCDRHHCRRSPLLLSINLQAGRSRHLRAAKRLRAMMC